MSTRRSIRVIINRELRRVPLDWQHPRYESGQFIPLFDRHYYTQAELEELLKEGKTLEEIEADLMPDFSHIPAEQLGLCVYETTSEGTPRSPVFADTPDGRWALVHYCASHVSVTGYRKVNAEAWAELLFGSQAVFDLTHDRILFKLDEPKAA